MSNRNETLAPQYERGTVLVALCLAVVRREFTCTTLSDGRGRGGFDGRLAISAFSVSRTTLWNTPAAFTLAVTQTCI